MTDATADKAGPGPANYFLPSTIGHNNHDISKSRSPSFSIGVRLPGLFCEQNIQSPSPGPKYQVEYLTKYGKANVASGRANLKRNRPRSCNNFDTSEMSQMSERMLPQPIKLKPAQYKYSNGFLRKIEQQFHKAKAYGHKETLENARRIIPRHTLLERTMRKYRSIQKNSKKDPTIGHIDIEDLMLVELLNWFKEEFFEWVDCPDCEFCGNKTEFSHHKNDPDNNYADRIEIFNCKICDKKTSFPRYNDVNILLETRKGRCGEWANTFTLLCCALNFDARLVVDVTDHVWTEVYSRFQKRWLHCDPCENICDNPLLYEHGWKKKLSYVMAYSPFEIQDVTWRYTSNFKEVLKRRTECVERELVQAIVELRNGNLSKFSKTKQDFIQMRTLLELTDFLTERQAGDEKYGGRTSGSLNWRLSRGDTNVNSDSSYYFKLIFPKLSKMEYSMKYSCSSDRYVYGTDLLLNQWDQATFHQEDIMRKVEKDWNKVYLCRREGTERGSIEWKFKLLDSNVRILLAYVKLQSQTFENGIVAVSVEGYSSDKQTKIEMDLAAGNDLRTEAFRGCQILNIKAILSGGRGPNAWQHAQLFRQDWRSDTTYYPFEIFLTFEGC